MQTPESILRNNEFGGNPTFLFGPVGIPLGAERQSGSGNSVRLLVCISSADESFTSFAEFRGSSMTSDGVDVQVHHQANTSRMMESDREPSITHFTHWTEALRYFANSLVGDTTSLITRSNPGLRQQNEDLSQPHLSFQDGQAMLHQRRSKLLEVNRYIHANLNVDVKDITSDVVVLLLLYKNDPQSLEDLCTKLSNYSASYARSPREFADNNIQENVDITSTLLDQLIDGLLRKMEVVLEKAQQQNSDEDVRRWFDDTCTVATIVRGCFIVEVKFESDSDFLEQFKDGQSKLLKKVLGNLSEIKANVMKTLQENLKSFLKILEGFSEDDYLKMEDVIKKVVEFFTVQVSCSRDAIRNYLGNDDASLEIKIEVNRKISGQGKLSMKKVSQAEKEIFLKGITPKSENLLKRFSALLDEFDSEGLEEKEDPKPVERLKEKEDPKLK